MTGARYRDLAARMADGHDLPDGPLAVPSATPQPGPYSEHAVAALVASRDARIRELEAEVAGAWRSAALLGSILEALVGRLTPEEAAAVAQEVAKVARAVGR